MDKGREAYPMVNLPMAEFTPPTPEFRLAGICILWSRCPRDLPSHIRLHTRPRLVQLVSAKPGADAADQPNRAHGNWGCV